MGAMEVLEIVFGLVLRIVLPVGATVGVALLLKRLDERWRKESLQDALALAGITKPIQSVACWEAHGCKPENRQNCKAFNNPERPCWEVMSLNGHMQESCKDCPFRMVKLAALKV